MEKGMTCVLRKGSFLDSMNTMVSLLRKIKAVKLHPLSTVNIKMHCEHQIKYKLKKI